MPWLAGTALMHSLAVTEKRGTFKARTVLLAITAFSLCLLGTFTVRSGVLVSVHSFASDPARGMFILAYLVIVIGGSLLLYAVKGGRAQPGAARDLLARDLPAGQQRAADRRHAGGAVGVRCCRWCTNSWGWAASRSASRSSTPCSRLMAPLALLLGIGPLVRWRRDEPSKLWRRLGVALLATLVLSILLPWLLQDSIAGMTVVGLIMALWVIILTLMELHERATHRHGFWRGLRQLSRSHWGMVLGHLGVAVTVIGIAFSQNYSVERDVRMKAGDSVDIHSYHFVFRDVHDIRGPNYSGGVGIIDVTRNGKPEATLHAEKRYYSVARSMMTEAAIDGGFSRDLYAALGEELEDGSRAVRLYYKPFVRWIWFGGVFMAIGGLLCILDPRYRMSKKLKREGKLEAQP